VIGVFLARHKPSPFEGPDSVGDVTGVKHGGIAKCGLAQLALARQRRQAAIRISVNPDPTKVVEQGLM